MHREKRGKGCAPRGRREPMKGRADDETDCANGGVGNRRVAGGGGLGRLRCGAVPQSEHDPPLRGLGHERDVAGRRQQQRRRLEARRRHRDDARARAQRRRTAERDGGRRGARPRRRADGSDAARLPRRQDQVLARPEHEHRARRRSRHEVVRPARDEHHGRGFLLRLSLRLQYLSLGEADTGKRPAPVARDRQRVRADSSARASCLWCVRGGATWIGRASRCSARAGATPDPTGPRRAGWAVPTIPTGNAFGARLSTPEPTRATRASTEIPCGVDTCNFRTRTGTW